MDIGVNTNNASLKDILWILVLIFTTYALASAITVNRSSVGSSSMNFLHTLAAS